MNTIRVLVLRAKILLPMVMIWLASSRGQQAFPPPIVVGVSVNGSESPSAYSGWPLLVTVTLIHENAYQFAPPMQLSPSWRSSLRFTVTASDGKTVTWPFHSLSAANESAVLDSTTYFETVFWMEPNEIGQITPGTYRLTVILDSMAYANQQARYVSARSRSVDVLIGSGTGIPTIDRKTDRDLLLASLSMMKGDKSKALEYLSGILTYNDRSTSAMVLIATILKDDGDYGGALYTYSRALQKFYAENAHPPEPPLGLLYGQRSLLEKMNKAESFLITLSKKDSTHPAYKMGSPLAYYVDNIPFRELLLVRGIKYTFRLKDIPANDALYFSTSAKGGGADLYTAGITGTPADSNETVTFLTGAATPNVLYYQSMSHDYVGWKIRVTDAGSVTALSHNEQGTASTFELSLAYPNPFNPTTQIQYRLPARSSVLLEIYDILGRHVTTLVDETKGVGSYEARWDASGVSSGIYFYRLRVRQESRDQAGEFVETKRMVLIK